MIKQLRIHLTENEQTLADLTFTTTLDLQQLLERIQQLLQVTPTQEAGALNKRDLAAIGTVGKKYVPLAEHLARVQGDTVTLTFEEIETILRSPLPPTARSTHAKAWWANTDTHSQGKAWLALRWKTTNIDADRKVIEFRRH